jgi:hypothetical protein
MIMPNFEAARDIALREIIDSLSNSEPAKISPAIAILTSYVNREIAPTDARCRLEALIGTSEPLRKLESMFNPNRPMSPILFAKPKAPPVRNRAFRWTPDDDARLVAAVDVHGVDHWPDVASELGGGRTKAQCAQRWFRCLDPNISKCTWTSEEEQRLIDLVASHGNKAWVKIARELGGRSDVQCRFRFFYLLKKAGENGTPVRPVSDVRKKPADPEERL